MAAGRIAEKQEVLARQVQPHHGLTDREHGNIRRLFGNDGGKGFLLRCQGGGGGCVCLVFFYGLQNVGACAFGQFLPGGGTGMGGDALVVTAQALGNVLGGIIKRGIGICGFAFSTQDQTPAGFYVDVACKKGAGLTKGDLRL